MHEELLIDITFEFRLFVQSLRPRFLHNGRTGLGLDFVQCGYAFKVNLFVQVRLQCWLKIVGMIMVIIAVTMPVGVPTVVVVMVIRHVDCMMLFPYHTECHVRIVQSYDLKRFDYLMLCKISGKERQRATPSSKVTRILQV